MYLIGLLAVVLLCGTAQNPVLAAQSPAEEYRVGIDDVLDIVFIKPESMASTVTVAPDGAITVPYIGNVQVKGMTLPDIQKEVQAQLAKNFMEFPVVSVSLRQTRSRKFVIYGEVLRPGAYPVEADMTLLHAITVAGGFSVSGSNGRIKLLRPKPGKSEMDGIEWDIASMQRGAGYDVNVLAGDTLIVSIDKCFVYGQVVRPGAYPVEDRMTLLQAITVAGGMIESGSTGRVKLLRPGAGKTKPEVTLFEISEILSGAKQNQLLQANDTIVVSMDKYFISGEVVRPGAYSVVEDMTLLHAINAAGGFSKTETAGRVKLLRPKINQSGTGEGTSPKKNMSNEFETILDLSISLVLTGGYQEAAVMPGDAIVVSTDKYFISGKVVRPGEYPINANMTLLNAITQAGGFIEQGATGEVKLVRQQGGGNTAKVKVWDIMDILDGQEQAEVVQSGDTIIVNDNRFFVYGEVVRPGMYPLHSDTTAFTAIALAGGFSKFGSASRVKIMRLNEETGKYDSIEVNLKNVISGKSGTDDTLLEAGDILVVSEGVF